MATNVIELLGLNPVFPRCIKQYTPPYDISKDIENYHIYIRADTSRNFQQIFIENKLTKELIIQINCHNSNLFIKQIKLIEEELDIKLIKTMDIIESLKLATENNIHYYRYIQYHGNNINIKVEIHVNVKPFETYNMHIYNLDEVDNISMPFPTEVINESIEVSDSDTFIKIIKILESKYNIKIIEV